MPSYHLRSIEHHQLDDPKPVYIISIFENFSRKVLASSISQTQNQWDYLAVLADAIRRYGVPEFLVTDGGGIFYSTIAVQIYDSLGIQKERIEAGAPWQNYAETLFSIQRRLADFGFSKASSWSEIEREHQKWMTNYTIEHHFAHRERQDGRHSPNDGLRLVLGRTYPEPVLNRILYATRFTRYLDHYGYVRFRNWRLFGEDGLANKPVSVWVYEGQIKIEYQATPLSIFTVTFEPDHKHIAEVKNPRRIETHFRSLQLDRLCSILTPNGCLLCTVQRMQSGNGVERSNLKPFNSPYLSLNRPGNVARQLLSWLHTRMPTPCQMVLDKAGQLP